MVIECCSQERSYSKFYGLMSERLAKLNPVWTIGFSTAFRQYYETIHRYETNKLRNIARLFGHALAADALPWTVFDVVRMNEDDTTSSSRIFLKILLQEMGETLGLQTLKARFADPTLRPAFAGMFPMDNPKNTRFSINLYAKQSWFSFSTADLFHRAWHAASHPLVSAY
jgi:pre-mRNA-splicing factor CWC22